MVKKIAVYGSYEAKIPSKQRYWIKRKDGIRQRYWKKTKATKTVEAKGRYEFHGKGKDLYNAVVKAHSIVPKGYVAVSAEEFLRNPEKYGSEGEWTDREIES
jgi:hypothetical protein